MTSRPAVPDSETPDGPIEVWHFARGPHGVKDAWVSETDYRSLERRLSLAQTEIKGHMRVEDELKAELQIVQPKAQVMHDLHDALGVKWGCDPYAEIRRLKRFEKFCEELLAQNTEAQARIAELELQLAASDTVMFNLSEEMKILKSRA